MTTRRPADVVGELRTRDGDSGRVSSIATTTSETCRWARLRHVVGLTSTGGSLCIQSGRRHQWRRHVTAAGDDGGGDDGGRGGGGAGGGVERSTAEWTRRVLSTTNHSSSSHDSNH